MPETTNLLILANELLEQVEPELILLFFKTSNFSNFINKDKVECHLYALVSEECNDA